jgi:hypothetical protein
MSSLSSGSARGHGGRNRGVACGSPIPAPPPPRSLGNQKSPEVARGWRAPGSSARLTRFGDGSLRPPAKSPRARQGFDRNPTLCRHHLHKLWRQQPDRAGLRPPATTSDSHVLTRLVRTARGSAPRVSRTVTSEYRSSARGPDELLEPLPDLVVPRSLSRERRPGRPSEPPASRCRRCHGEGSVAVQWGTSGTSGTSGPSATRTATSGNSSPTPEPLGSWWREPRSPVASGKGRRVRGRRRTHTRRRRTARRTGMHSWPSRSPVREAS